MPGEGSLMDKQDHVEALSGAFRDSPVELKLRKAIESLAMISSNRYPNSEQREIARTILTWLGEDWEEVEDRLLELLKDGK